MNKYSLISINLQQTEVIPPLLSPINFLSSKTQTIKNELLRQNQLLKKQLEKLMCELDFRKDKNISLRQEVIRQDKKLTSWKNCYEKSEEEYILKKQFIENLQTKLKDLKTINAGPRRMAMEDEDIYYKIMDNCEDQNENSFKLSKNISKEGKSIAYLPKMNRVNSIALQRKKTQRKQALSLTHLHRYTRQNY